MFKKIFTAIWTVILLLGCQLVSAATTLSVSATPNNAAAPATVVLSVSAASDSGPVALTQVEYFSGATSLGIALEAPFSLALNDLPAGTYAISAKATTDDPNSQVVQSTVVQVTVGLPAGAAPAYFIHADQLNTPRVISDANGATVWQWDSDPFGKDAANEQPGGQPTAIFNLRFPGQYFDRESNLHYNYFRDYDPALGRYVESDPIGLKGGINTYGYVLGNPLGLSDPDGLCPFCIVIPGVCAAGGCEIGAAAIVGAGVYAQSKKPPRVEDPAAAAEHKAYKDAYKQPPPPDQDPCERLKWQLAREKALLTARMAWDAKWGAHHGEAITQSMNAIKNIEAKIKNTPGCTCP